MQNGPLASGMKIECQPLSLSPLLGGPLAQRSVGLRLLLCRSAGIFICKRSKVEFFKGKQFAKDGKQTTWDEWLIWRWEIASGT